MVTAIHNGSSTATNFKLYLSSSACDKSMTFLLLTDLLMRKSNWKKHHKWLGLGFAFFMMMFCLSGIILNHRTTFADLDVSRKWLPASYSFTKWNGGVLRGTLKGTFGADSILIYGNSGIWTTCEGCEEVHDFNKDFPSGADYKNIKSCIHTADGSLWAAAQFGLYRYDCDKSAWQHVPLYLTEDDKLFDLTLKGDSLIVVKSFLLICIGCTLS